MNLAAHDLAQSVAGRRLFRALSFEASPGTVTVVLGPNGSGKSTLLRKLAGLEAPEAGHVSLDGARVLELAPRERARRIAYLPQSTSLYHDLRVRELVRLGRAPHLGRFATPGDDDEVVVDRALERVGVRSLEDRGLSSLSGGERQRVMLARMLATAAPVLVLDEPTTALDIGHALAFLELCRALAEEGATLVIAMHDLDRARDYADRAICLGFSDGETAAGAADEVLEPSKLAHLFGVRVELTERPVFRPKPQG